MNYRKRLEFARVTIFLICSVWFLVFAGFLFAGSYPFVWTPEKVRQVIARGDSRDVRVQFSSSKALQNVDLWVVEDMKPYVSINPNHFGSISKNTPVNVTLHISPSSDVPVGSYDGTIHLKVGSKTYPQTLKVKLTFVDFVENIGPAGGVVELTNTNNELYGTKIVVPAGALSSSTPISITRTGIPADLPEDTANAGIFVELGPEGTKFNNNIQVTIPYEDKDNDGILDYSKVPEENIFVMTWDGSAMDKRTNYCARYN